MARKKYKVFNALGQPEVIYIDQDATKGATVGVDVYNPDGTLWVPPIPASDTPPVGSTTWSLILEKPPNIDQVAALATSGLVVRKASGAWVTRAIQQPASVKVTNGDGDAGNPSLALDGDVASPGLGYAYATSLLTGDKGWYHPSLFESTGVLAVIPPGPALSTTPGTTVFSVAQVLVGHCDYAASPANPVRTLKLLGPFANVPVTNILTSPATYVGLDVVAGTVIQSTTPFTNAQSRDIAPLGVVVHTNLATTNAVNNLPYVIRAGINQLLDYLNYRSRAKKGIVYAANGANLNLNRSLGSIFVPGGNFANNEKDPNVVPIVAQTALTFRYRTMIGEPAGDVTAINPNVYNSAAGTLTAVPSNDWQAQRIFVFPSGLTRIQYGQATYPNLAAALAGYQIETFTTEQNIADNGTLCGWLLVKEGATQLNNDAQAKFIPAGTDGVPSTPAVALANTDSLAEGVVNLYFTNARAIAAGSGVYQPLDATLTALAANDWALNSFPIGSGANTLAQVNFAANTFPARASTGNLVAKTITDFGLSLVDDANAAAGRTTLGATTVGGNLFTMANPGAIRFIQINADNSVSALDAAAFRAAIGAGTGAGTVTTVSVVTANGVSGSVANATTTPAITLTLGAITPTSVASSGAVSGTTGTFTGNLANGAGTGAALHTINGASSGTAAGSAIYLQNAGVTNNAVGGRSAIFGGAFDNRMSIYGISGIVLEHATLAAASLTVGTNFTATSGTVALANVSISGTATKGGDPIAVTVNPTFTGTTTVATLVATGTGTFGGSVAASGFQTNVAASGYVAALAGDSTHTGYFEWRQNGGTRAGFAGFAESSTKVIFFNAENAYTWQFSGGGVQITEDLSVQRSAAPTTGALFMGNTGLVYLFYNGSGWEMSGGPLTISQINATDCTLNGASKGGGTVVFAMTNATTVPTVNPTGGGVIYIQAGALKYRGSSGTVTTLAPA